MNKTDKIKFLRLLYQYRAMGFEYFYDYKPSKKFETTTYLSNDLEAIAKSVKGCYLCNLAKNRKNTVFGEGNIHAKVMFIGEAPGANEDEMGKPFVGRAGQLLTKIIENVLQLQRKDVYIANVIKCRPPENRVPTPEEVGECKPYLLQQIKLISPQIIVALGATSFHHLTGEYDTPISKIRGEVLEFAGAKLIPTYHPSFLLRNPSAKKDVFEDMLKVKAML
ncbi:MAG: uracil-DNA glycosylase [Sulfurospirillum sp.]|nr:uracil-DNA glycosylase [Sulfurospirillum sp.]